MSTVYKINARYTRTNVELPDQVPIQPKPVNLIHKNKPETIKIIGHTSTDNR